MKIAKYVGERIREMRTTFGGSGISQEELAKRLKVAPNTVSRWETATYKPKLHDLDKLAGFFGVGISDFFPSEEEEPLRALTRAAKGLPATDIEALRQFAEIKRAQHILKKG